MSRGALSAAGSGTCASAGQLMIAEYPLRRNNTARVLRQNRSEFIKTKRRPHILTSDYIAIHCQKTVE